MSVLLQEHRDRTDEYRVAVTFELRDGEDIHGAKEKVDQAREHFHSNISYDGQPRFHTQYKQTGSRTWVLLMSFRVKGRTAYGSFPELIRTIARGINADSILMGYRGGSGAWITQYVDYDTLSLTDKTETRVRNIQLQTDVVESAYGHLVNSDMYQSNKVFNMEVNNV